MIDILRVLSFFLKTHENKEKSNLQLNDGFSLITQKT